jgi:murein DD-endopeptidase MepM/ murein hydrolase activator NlpD
MHSRNSHWAELSRRVLRRLNVERQIYLRSHGQVQFVSLSPFAQGALAAVAFIFFCWVAYASVNVVFKEQIIAAKDQRLAKIQGAYEERLAQLQSSYDDINGQLVVAQERFLAQTRDMEEKHRQIAALVTQRQMASAELDNQREQIAVTLRGSQEPGEQHSEAQPAPTVLDTAAPNELAQGGPEEAEAAGTFVATDSLAGDAAHSPSVRLQLAGDPDDVAGQNGTKSQIDARLARLDRAQRYLINEMEVASLEQVRSLEKVIRMTKLPNPENVVKRLGPSKDAGGEGGPLLGVREGEALAGSSGDEQLLRISQNFSRMADLKNSIARMPIATPLSTYRQSSGFGRRVDLFTRKWAFHSGEDFAATYGTKVHNTLTGVVTHADWQGPYGRMVEITDENGFRIRFGHLSQINVRLGQKVAFQQVIGEVGSSGRSNGPHLHYEIWLDGIVRDPSKFIEAGHHVFAKQR